MDGDERKPTCPAPAPAINMKITSSILRDSDVIVEIRPQARDHTANPE